MPDFGWKNTITNATSPTALSTVITRNPWARGSSDKTTALNLHRTDLWYVDFSTASKGITTALSDQAFDLGNDVTAPSTTNLPPYFVKSITLPETKVSAQPFKRDGIPFNMPSWDEPLDAVSVVFWMQSINPNPVIRFLTDWLSLVRAGRGERYTDGYDTTVSNELTLNSNFTIDFSFPFKLWLLQGAIGSTPAGFQTLSNPLSLLPGGSATAAAIAQTLSVTSSYCVLQAITGFEIRAWLASFKLADLTYEGTQILSVEAKFFPEYITQT